MEEGVYIGGVIVQNRALGKDSGAFPFEHGALSYSVYVSFQKVEGRGV